ncbi:hypothetical protein V6N13_093326 [Hibiscus sabdariffa]|uniref:Uncharacterized protein n=2 Tax=Hibiscus sabdariffa TaxID=183260 RepID=A0ABR2A5G0_9ROSI
MLRFTLVYAPKIYERKSPGIGRKFKCLTQATPLGSAIKSSVSSSTTGYPRESPELALKFKICHIEIFGNAELVIKQMTTEYEVWYEGLAMYHDLAQRLFECFLMPALLMCQGRITQLQMPSETKERLSWV